MQGGKGRVERCQIRGMMSGVLVQGDGSEAVVVGCKCVRKGRVECFLYERVVSQNPSDP